MASKQPTPIRTDLFRFVTIRTPQLISEERKKWGYIFHPAPAKSAFLKGINTPNIDKARSDVKSAADVFKPVSSVADLKKLYPELYDFAGWLTRNRNVLAEADVNARIKTAKKLSDDELLWVWDNLFYQVLERTDAMIRQACIQLIVADNFLKVLEKGNIKKIAENIIQTPKTPLPPDVSLRLELFMRRVAKAKVVIPKPFSVKRQETDQSADDSETAASATALSQDTKKTKNDSGGGKGGNDKDASNAETKLYGVNRLGIGILRKVEQEVCCYVPGEVSRIENILAREYKERQTRSLISTEVTEEDTTEIEVENQSDTVSTTRNELQSEIANSLTKDSSINTGASLGVDASAGFLGNGATVSAEGYFDFASSTSSTTSDSEAQTYAQEVTNSALERVLQKTTQKRTSRILQEFEENNRHGYDNREGTEHVTGVYRWVDIIYKNRLINYGKRLMFEFLIPEPAKFYRDVLQKRAEEEQLPGEIIPEPEKPADHDVKNPSDIEGYDTSKKSYYAKLSAAYDVELTVPVEQYVYIEQTFFQSGLNKDKFGSSGTIVIPAGYRCESAEALCVFEWEGNKSTDWYVQLGGKKVLREEHPDSVDGKPNVNEFSSGTLTFDDNLINTVSFSISGEYTYSYHISVTLKCKVLDEDYESWQSSCYQKVMEAYNALQKEYEQSVAEAENREKRAYNQRSGGNRKFNRTVEQRELKRIAIEMLTKPFDLAMGKDFYYEGKRCKIPLVEQTQAWDKYSARVKFFEQAFEWGFMSYLFYPYYWADKCDWRDLFQLEPSDDQIFEAFLQSGMARAVIPVRKGFEEAVNYYLETGDIWNGGGMVMETDDDLYLSVDEELMEAEGFVDQEWQTRVPTTLTIVQGKSVYLEDESLPCCSDVETAEVDTLLRPSTTILGVSSQK